MERSKDFNYLFNDAPLYTKEFFYPFELNDGKYYLNDRNIKQKCYFI